MIDTAVLAGTVVSSILVPFLKKGSERFAADIGQKAGQTAAGHVTRLAEKLWGRVRGLFGGGPEQRVVEDFEQYPDELSGRIEKLLEERLQNDQRLVRELEALVRETTPDGAGSTLEIINATYGGILHAEGAQISGGVVGGVVVGDKSMQQPDHIRRRQD
jgi:hypothetical protein